MRRPSPSKLDTAYIMVQSAFREVQAADERAAELGRQILATVARDEVDRLSALLEQALVASAAARSRLIAATHAYADAL